MFDHMCSTLKISYRKKWPQVEQSEAATRKIWSENQIKKRVTFDKEKKLAAIRERLEATRDQREKGKRLSEGTYSNASKNYRLGMDYHYLGSKGRRSFFEA